MKLATLVFRCRYLLSTLLFFSFCLFADDINSNSEMKRLISLLDRNEKPTKELKEKVKLLKNKDLKYK